MNGLLRAVLSMAFSVVASASHAVVLYEQPLVDWSAGACSPCALTPDYNARVFGSFSLATDSILQGGSFAIVDVGAGSGDYNISIWDLSLGNELYSLTALNDSYTKIATSDPRNFYVVFDLPNWQLGAGSYWVSLFGGESHFFGWGHDFSSGDDRQYTAAGVLHAADLYVGFSLSGVKEVPESGSISLTCIGLSGFALKRRRGRQIGYRSSGD